MLIHPTRSVLTVVAVVILISLKNLHSILEIAPKVTDSTPINFVASVLEEGKLRKSNSGGFKNKDYSQKIRCYECLHEQLFSSRSAPFQSEYCPMIPVAKHDNMKMPPHVDWKQCPPYEYKTTYQDGELHLPPGTYRISTVDKFPFSPDGVTKNYVPDPKWKEVSGGSVEVEAEMIRVMLPTKTEEIHVQMIENKTAHQAARELAKNTYGDKRPLNIAVLVLDTMPRPYLATYFPKTVSFLKALNNQFSNPYRAFSFVRYNSQPGSTSPNLTPVFSGKAFPGEMEAGRVKTLRWVNPPGVTPDDWLQNWLLKRGYITMFGSPTSNLWMGTAWWDRSGFVHVPPVYVNYSNYRHTLISAGARTGYCIQGKQCHQVLFDYNKDMWRIYSDVPKYSYIHYHEGHDLQQTAGVMDNEIPGFIEDMMADNNTIVFFMSDHGANSIHNRPFLNIIVPNWWMWENKLEDILFSNQEELFSAYDLHKTLKHAATLPELPDVPEEWLRHYPSISLFEDIIPANRTCITARIPPNHCFCEPWREPWEVKKKITDPDYSWLVSIMMEKINNEPGIKGGLCPSFSFKQVDLVAWKDPKEEIGVRYWMLEATMNEGHPHRYTMSLKETVSNKGHDDYQVLMLKQITRYFMYEKCTPVGASPEFCVCQDS